MPVKLDQAEPMNSLLTWAEYDRMRQDLYQKWIYCLPQSGVVAGIT